MFGKLRLKLALMNVAVAGLILLSISAVAYIFIARTITKQSEQAIATIARDLDTTISVGSTDASDAAGPIGGNYPYVVMRTDNNRGAYPYLILRIENDQILIQDFQTHLSQVQITELVTRAIAKENEYFTKASQNSDRGIISRRVTFVRRPVSTIVKLSDGNAFRYSITGMRPGATSISMIFLDMHQEQALLGSVGLALGGSVLGGLVLTLVGGLFLAGRALRPVKAAWQKQRSFVADASHELRSPLAAIRCNLDVVLDDPSAPVGEKQLYWEGISEETSRMTVLVDELLMLARADSDAVVLQREKVYLGELAEGAVCFMQPLATKKGISLTIDPGEPLTVLGDQARLKQVLIALIDNALKYTPEGGQVHLQVKKTRDKAAIEISDTGIGIAKEHLDKIFERFYRVDKARDRESGGNGLGLSIAYWIVQQLGGTLTVTSEEGKGSCFTVTLPLMKE